jgi:hypothetical protein
MGVESKKKGTKGRSRRPAIVPELNRSSSSESKSKDPPLDGGDSFLGQKSKRKVNLVVVENEATEMESLMVEEVEKATQRE